MYGVRTDSVPFNTAWGTRGVGRARPPGLIVLHATVEEPVSMRGESDPIVLAPGEHREGVEIVIAREHPTTGRLRDAAGRPLAGETLGVRLSSARDPDQRSFPFKGLTDDAGAFALDVPNGLMADLYHLRPIRSPVLLAGVKAPAIDLDLVSTATPRHALDLRVLGPDGFPVSFFRVSTWGRTKDGGSTLGLSNPVVYGRDGAARIEVFNWPRIHIFIQSPRDAAGRMLPLDSLEVVLETLPQGIHEIRFPARGEVRGVVVGVDGLPVAGAHVWSSYGKTIGRTEEDGTFLVTDIPAKFNAVDLRVRGPPRFCAAPVIEARVGGEPVRIVLRPGGVIRGRFPFPTGVDREGLSVYAFWVNRSPWEAAMTSASIDEDGAFTLEGVPLERDITVILGEPSDMYDLGYYTVSVKGVRAGVTDLVIPLREGKAIRGCVRDPEGRFDWMPHCTVLVFDAEGARVREVSAHPLDDRVPFTIQALPEGRYTIRVQVSGCLLVEVDGVPAGTQDLEVRIPPLAGVAGRVLGLPSGALAHVYGRVPGRAAASAVDWSAVTNKGGVFGKENVPAGRSWSVIAVVREHGLVGVLPSVAAGSSNVVIRLEEGLSIAGRLRRKDGGPTPRYHLTAVGDTVHAWGRSKPDGTFRLGPLVPGTYRIDLSVHNYLLEETVAVDVPAGTRGLEIVLP